MEPSPGQLPTLHQLRLFLAVVEHGTVAAAAESSGYTPSAVSQQLAGLENACATPLFDRVGRGLRLTDAGRVLVDHAKSLTRGVEAAVAAVADVDGVLAGRLRLGAYESVASSLVPELLARLRRDHPDVHLHVHQTDPDDAIPTLADGGLDLAFTVDLPYEPREIRADIVRWTIADDYFHAVVPVDDPARDGVIDLRELADRRFIGEPQHHSCGKCVISACREAGFEPDLIHTLDDYTTSLQLVAAGEGVALVPDLALRWIPDGVRVLDLATPVVRTIQLAVRAASSTRRTHQLVRDLLLDVSRSLALSTPAA